MSDTPLPTSRREFLKDSGRLAAASALAGVALPAVHAAEGNTIQLALVGCGGRGTGAIADALHTKAGPVKLVAMADVFPGRLSSSLANLQGQFAAMVDVPGDRQFVGFDAYQKAMACLKPGDIAVLGTPSAFRWVHFGEAVGRGLNVFMEKSLVVDGPGARRFLATADESVKKGLKVGVGLMCRHCKARQELQRRIQDGQLGDILTMRCYRMHGPAGVVGPRPQGENELLFQVRNFHGFPWAGGGFYVDWLIHNIDECCMMKGAWPVRAQGSGGRQDRGIHVDQNFDHYTVEYTFADGSKLFAEARGVANCHNEFASYAHGTKGLAVISSVAHSPARCRIYKGHNQVKDELAWSFPPDEPNPYQLEWDDLMAAIRGDKPYNEARRGAEASLVAVMGRHACHTGKVVTFEEMLKHAVALSPGVEKFTTSSPAPVTAGPDGKYPLPRPGAHPDREYAG